MWILDKIAEMLIIVKIVENVDLGQNLQIPRIWSKFSKKLDFGQNFHQNVDFGEIVKIVKENNDFSRNLQKD